jgi:hypothetical protein
MIRIEEIKPFPKKGRPNPNSYLEHEISCTWRSGGWMALGRCNCNYQEVTMTKQEETKYKKIMRKINLRKPTTWAETKWAWNKLRERQAQSK